MHARLSDQPVTERRAQSYDGHTFNEYDKYNVYNDMRRQIYEKQLP